MISCDGKPALQTLKWEDGGGFDGMLALDPNEICICSIDMSRIPKKGSFFGIAPSQEELTRAMRFGQEVRQRHFIAVRVALRRLLGLFLGLGPENVALGVGEHGKPVLAGCLQDKGLVFNISHSGDWTLLAFARDRALGIDVERVRPLSQQSALAERCLAEAELQSWRHLTESDRLLEFFRYWVCKEAFGKATGLGIQVGLSSVEIAENPLRLTSIPAVHGSVGDWHLEQVEVAAGYLACACYNGRKARVQVAQLALEPGS